MKSSAAPSHRILIDEAHYYLHGPNALELLDLEQNGYTVVTYRPSRLPEEFLAAIEVMVVTAESDPVEIEAFRRYCDACAQLDSGRRSMLGHLKAGQAVALPVTKETAGDLRLFNLGRRLTPHVRHREKYVDVPVADYQAFVFGSNGHVPVRRIRTLRQFVGELERVPATHLDGYVRRGDFSRWIGEVFGDYVLATELRKLEERHRTGTRAETVPDIVNAIRNRYELLEEIP